MRRDAEPGLPASLPCRATRRHHRPASHAAAQARNLQLALKRLQAMLDAAAVVPKERVISLEPPAHIKKRRKEAKQHHSKKKQRRSGKFDGY